MPDEPQTRLTPPAPRLPADQHAAQCPQECARAPPWPRPHPTNMKVSDSERRTPCRRWLGRALEGSLDSDPRRKGGAVSVIISRAENIVQFNYSSGLLGWQSRVSNPGPLTGSGLPTARPSASPQATAFRRPHSGRTGTAWGPGTCTPRCSCTDPAGSAPGVFLLLFHVILSFPTDIAISPDVTGCSQTPRGRQGPGRARQSRGVNH